MTEEAAVPEQRAVSADEQALLRRLRAGEDKAFSELFELHAAAVRRLALGLAADRTEAEDITAETFFRVLQALRRGAGPKEHIRAYLLTVARRVSWEWHGARRDVPVADDELNYRADTETDAHAGAAERNLIVTAFASLPERWRTVLWQTEVEGEQPAVVAPNFGLSANATAALARRARQGLRAAYLQAHLAMNRTSDVGCRGVIEKLGGYTAGSVTGSEARRIRAHLLGCASCRSMHAELREVCSSLRAHSGALIMLVPAIGAVAGAASGAGSGMLVALKGLLLSKLKVGIALMSTAAVGVVGFTVGPALLDSAHSHPTSLPGGAELRIGVPSLLSPPPVSVGAPDEVTVSFPGVPQSPARPVGSSGGADSPANAGDTTPSSTASVASSSSSVSRSSRAGHGSPRAGAPVPGDGSRDSTPNGTRSDTSKSTATRPTTRSSTGSSTISKGTKGSVKNRGRRFRPGRFGWYCPGWAYGRSRVVVGSVDFDASSTRVHRPERSRVVVHRRMAKSVESARSGGDARTGYTARGSA